VLVLLRALATVLVWAPPQYGPPGQQSREINIFLWLAAVVGRAMVESWYVSGFGAVQRKAVHRSAENVQGGPACQNDEQVAQKLRIALAKGLHGLDMRRTLHCVDRERCVQPQLFALFDGDINLILECVVFSQCYNPAFIPFDSGCVIRIDNDDIIINNRGQWCLYRFW
jgi:hypothetical protein